MAQRWHLRDWVVPVAQGGVALGTALILLEAQKTMKKIIINKETVALAKKEMLESAEKCYLDVMHALLTSLEKAQTEEEKQKFRALIEETEKNYKEFLQK